MQLSKNENNIIWNIVNKNYGRMKLWKSVNGEFRIIEMGAFKPLLTGSDYTLLDEKFISVFEDLLADEIEFKRAKIIRKRTGETWSNYFELDIKEHINPEKIKIIDTSFERIWQYQHHVFISSELKERFINLGKNIFNFNQEFSHFG